MSRPKRILSRPKRIFRSDVIRATTTASRVSRISAELGIVFLLLAGAACVSPAPSPSEFTPPSASAPPSGVPTSTAAPATAPISTVASETPVEPTVEPLAPTPEIGGLEGLTDDLAAAGAKVGFVGVANGRPLAASQAIVCADLETIRVFEYASDELRAMTAARIDPDDPSHIGRDIYDWAGTPRFWQRDRVIVLYVGSDEETVALLTTLLGDPFAHGRGRPLTRPDTC